MIANSYLFNLTLELSYRSDIMTDTENDCKQKRCQVQIPRKTLPFLIILTHLFSRIFFTEEGLLNTPDQPIYRTPASVPSGYDRPES